MTLTAVVQAKDRSISRSGKEPFDDLRCVQPPIESDRAPHNVKQTKPLLRLLNAEPAHTVGGTKQSRSRTSSFKDRLLGTKQFSDYELRRFHPQSRVRIGVIAELVTCRHNLACNLRKAPHVHAALKERGWDLFLLENA